MKPKGKITKIKFKNSFQQEEEEGIILALKSLPARDIDGSIYLESEMRHNLFHLENKKDSFTFILKNDRHERLLRDLEKLGLPYLIETLKNGIAVSGVVYNGVNKKSLIYDNEGNILGRMDGITDAIELLEENEDMRALVLLNQFCIRTDVENMQRMAFPI